MWCRPPSPAPPRARPAASVLGGPRGPPRVGLGRLLPPKQGYHLGRSCPALARRTDSRLGASCQVPPTDARRTWFEPRRPCYLELFAVERLLIDFLPAGHRLPFIVKPASGLPVRSPLRKALPAASQPSQGHAGPGADGDEGQGRPSTPASAQALPGQLSVWRALRASCRRLLAREQGRLPGSAPLAQLPKQPGPQVTRKLAWMAEGRPGPLACVDLYSGF